MSTAADQHPTEKPAVTYISWHEAQRRAGNRSRTTLWRWVRDGLFPKPRRIGPGSSAFVEAEVDAWAKRLAEVEEA